MSYLLGHLIGDYLLQTNPMALGKSGPGWRGHAWCSLHCCLYAAAVCGMTWTWTPLAFVLVFATHWPVDRFSLGAYYMRYVQGWPKDYNELAPIRLAFLPVVYVGVDNTFHLLTLWALQQFGVLN